MRYAFTKTCRKFHCKLNGKAILVFPTRKFPKFTERLERYSKISDRCVSHVSHSQFSPVPSLSSVFTCVTILVPIALFASLSRRGRSSRNEFTTTNPQSFAGRFQGNFKDETTKMKESSTSSHDSNTKS